MTGHWKCVQSTAVEPPRGGGTVFVHPFSPGEVLSSRKTSLMRGATHKQSFLRGDIESALGHELLRGLRLSGSDHRTLEGYQAALGKRSPSDPETKWTYRVTFERTTFPASLEVPTPH